MRNPEFKKKMIENDKQSSSDQILIENHAACQTGGSQFNYFNQKALSTVMDHTVGGTFD